MVGTAVVSPNASSRRARRVPSVSGRGDGSRATAPLTPSPSQSRRGHRNSESMGSIGSGARRSLATLAAYTTQRPSSSCRERSSSASRIESSLISMQVELAKEKKENIDLEQRVARLQKEVDQLRLENLRLSDLIEAGQRSAVGQPQASLPFTGNDAAATARVGSLEARLSELSLALAAKDREMDAKDLRIRLLEHKLADQLLSEMRIPASPSVGLQDGSPTPSSPSRVHYATPPHGPSSLYLQSSIPDTAIASRSPIRSRGPVVHTSQLQSPPEILTEGADGSPRHPTRSAVRLVTSNSLSRTPTTASRCSTPPPPSCGAGGGSPSGPATLPSPVPLPPPPTTRSLGSQPHGEADGPPGSGRRRMTPRVPSATPPPPGRPSSAPRSGILRRGEADSSSQSRPSSVGRRTLVPSPLRRGSVQSVGENQRPAYESPMRSSSSRVSRRPSVRRRDTASSAAGADGETSVFSRRASTDSVARRGSLSRTPSASGGHPMQANLVSPFTGAHGSPSLMNQPILSSHRAAARRPSAPRSIARSVRSSTSTRSRPQITYSADSDTMQVKSSSMTVVFQNTTARPALMTSPYLQSGAPLLPLREAAAASATAGGVGKPGGAASSASSTPEVSREEGTSCDMTQDADWGT